MLDPKEEQKHKRLKRLAQELHLPIPEAFIKLEVFDKDGKLLQRYKQRSHSWGRNAYNLLLSQMASKNLDDVGVFGAGLLSIKDTDAAIRAGIYGAMITSTGTVTCEAATVAYRAAAGAITHGILVGNNNGAWDFDQYVLLGPIDEGTGGGELNHVAMDVPTKSYATLTWTITWIRYFNNNSGGNVLVKETAVVTHGLAGGAARDFLMSRDVLGATVTVPDTGQLKVTYTFILTYPE